MARYVEFTTVVSVSSSKLVLRKYGWWEYAEKRSYTEERGWLRGYDRYRYFPDGIPSCFSTDDSGMFYNKYSDAKVYWRKDDTTQDR